MEAVLRHNKYTRSILSQCIGPRTTKNLLYICGNMNREAGVLQTIMVITAVSATCTQKCTDACILQRTQALFQPGKT